MSVKLAVAKSHNFTEPDFWSNYKIGRGDDEMANLVDFAFRSTNLSIVYVTAANESNEARELIEILLNGKADLLLKKIVPLTLDAIKITNAISGTSSAIAALKHPYSSQPLYSVYLSLSYQSWLVILLYVLLLSIISAILEARYYPRTITKKRFFFIYLFQNIGNLLTQGRSRFPRSKRGKALFLLTILAFTILFAFYNGNFQAGYAVPNGYLINSFEDLIRKNIQILISKSSPSYYFFTKLREEAQFKSLKERLLEVEFEDYVNMSRNGSLVENIENEKLVVIDSISNLKDYVFSSSARPQNLKISDKSYFPSSVVLALNKNISNDVLEIVNYRINQFVETNQKAPYHSLLNWKMSKMPTERLNAVDPLSNRDLMPVFLINLIGNSICAFLLVYETRKYLKRNRVK